jgi:hypothetical protein
MRSRKRRSEPSCRSPTPILTGRLSLSPFYRYTSMLLCVLKPQFDLTRMWTWVIGLQEYLNLQARVTSKHGGAAAGAGGKTSFLKSSITTLLHNLNQAEKSSYVAHINTYLGEDPFLKKYLPIDPSGNQLFDLIRDGVLLW